MFCECRKQLDSAIVTLGSKYDKAVNLKRIKSLAQILVSKNGHWWVGWGRGGVYKAKYFAQKIRCISTIPSESLYFLFGVPGDNDIP